MRVEDLLLLDELFLLELFNVPDFTILSALLDFSHYLSFFAHELVLLVKQILLELHVNVFLLMLKFLNF